MGPQNALNPDAILPGETLTGFLARLDAASPPASVLWQAAALSPFGIPFEGGGFWEFSSGTNPVFLGKATLEATAPIPEPGTLLLLGSGLTAMGVRARRSRRNPSARHRAS